MEAIHFAVTADDLEKSKRIEDFISMPTYRNRMITNNLAASVAKNILDDFFDTDIESSVGNLLQVLSDFEISDIYVNGYCIDVRLSVDNGDLCIPTKTYMSGVIPYAYMFIKLSEDLSEGDVLGFVFPSDIQNLNTDSEYITIDQNLLKDYDEFRSAIAISADETVNRDSDLQIFNFLDGRLSNPEEFFTLLLSSKETRIKLRQAYKAEVIFNKLHEFDEKQTSEDINDMLGFEDNNSEDFENFENFNDDISQNIETDIYVTENATMNYETETIPSLEELENSDRIMESEDSDNYAENYQNDAMSENVIPENNTQIDTLFTNEEISQNIPTEQNINTTKVSKRNSIFPVFLIVLIMAGASYYGYNNFIKNNTDSNAINDIPIVKPQFASEENKPKQDAMPVETVEGVDNSSATDEAESVVIPAAEQNLNTAVYISNLSANWNVPQGYVSNAAAKRYLTKIGKVIQLNLKTELLLVSKVPLSNKVEVELQLEKGAQKFKIKGFISSSGEKVIDDIIQNVITSVLDAQQSQQVSMFEKIPGNPVLVIKF